MSAWTIIQHIEVGAGGASNITFSSIPSTYTDLCLVVSARTNTVQNSNGAYFEIRPNSETANRSYRNSGSDGTNAYTSSESSINARCGASDFTANTFGNTSIYISNYSASTTKVFSIDTVFENNATFARSEIHAAQWASASVISSLLLQPGGGSFIQYSSATLYGITKGSSGGVTVS